MNFSTQSNITIVSQVEAPVNLPIEFYEAGIQFIGGLAISTLTTLLVVASVKGLREAAYKSSSNLRSLEDGG